MIGGLGLFLCCFEDWNIEITLCIRQRDLGYASRFQIISVWGLS